MRGFEIEIKKRIMKLNRRIEKMNLRCLIEKRGAL